MKLNNSFQIIMLHLNSFIENLQFEYHVCLLLCIFFWVDKVVKVISFFLKKF